MNTGIEKGYGFNSFTAGIGVSFGGKIDFEAGSYNTSYDREKVGLMDNKAKSRYIEVHFTWWLLKAEILQISTLISERIPCFSTVIIQITDMPTEQI